MKKMSFFTLGLTAIALAAVFTFTNAFSPKDALLMENVEVLAQVTPPGLGDNGALAEIRKGGEVIGFCCMPSNVRNCDEQGIPWC